jgi:hypothetical protein
MVLSNAFETSALRYRVDQHAWVAVSDRSTLRVDGARPTLEFD